MLIRKSIQRIYPYLVNKTPLRLSTQVRNLKICNKETDRGRKILENEEWLRFGNTNNSNIPPYQSSSLKNQNQLEDVSNSAENGHVLNEPIVFISKSDFKENWELKFIEASRITVRQVKGLLVDKYDMFSPDQLLLLFKSLESYQDTYNMHELSVILLPQLNKFNGNSKAFQELLVTILRVEYKLKKYRICEHLFSECIKYPIKNPVIYRIGLNSFIENDNFHLANGFYIQALESPDIFPLTTKELFSFLLKLYEFKDLYSMERIFIQWLKKKCDKNTPSEHDPTTNILSLMHRAYRNYGTDGEFQEFLENEYVNKLRYSETLQFKCTEFLTDLYEKEEYENDITKKYEDSIALFGLLENLPAQKRGFYLALLNSAVKHNDFEFVKLLSQEMKKDNLINFGASYHLIVSEHFAKNGHINELLTYFNELVLQQEDSCVRLSPQQVLTFRDCLVKKYPILTREIHNELKTIITKPVYYEKIGWTISTDRDLSKLISYRALGGSQYMVPYLNHVDYDRFLNFSKLIKERKIAEAKLSLTDIFQRNLKPSFNLCFMLFRLSIQNNFRILATIIDDYLRQCQNDIPISMKLLWLRNDVLGSQKSIASTTETSKFGLKNKKSMRWVEVENFSRNNVNSLNFTSYIQLSKISILLKNYSLASEFINKAFSKMDKKNEMNWASYYLVSLWKSTVTLNQKQFLNQLKEWNKNQNGNFITQGHLRRIKQYSTFFSKRSNYIDNYDPNLDFEIKQEVEYLAERFVDYKFQGLNDIKRTCDILDKWLEKQVNEKEQKLKSIKAFNKIKYNKNN
ncbi:hypothetical protein Kpol_480p21 [Vanderwaltozyma polyspora DSM 70294]|uniref:Uncharacterized protein n=1 Tax=Vanderwaltozyma polyspora (strain ATCC 22028 / DSM 70294 / BCRC 21397 / CBS 2163 / NBRC 10782 / NRRL Y-8283 / UCD 57-17) TaxID=436907 RepID=A7TP83_VANPO|nr:uncharacterized protein Kpol_480p21 [Vanderwaltozyma polyspora DSM 70294]EDO15934.1 hypothetical protein Kpol_480p21 [Vanderwaltozyma polyspora DSM 70294]